MHTHAWAKAAQVPAILFQVVVAAFAISDFSGKPIEPWNRVQTWYYSYIAIVGWQMAVAIGVIITVNTFTREGKQRGSNISDEDRTSLVICMVFSVVSCAFIILAFVAFGEWLDDAGELHTFNDRHESAPSHYTPTVLVAMGKWSALMMLVVITTGIGVTRGVSLWVDYGKQFNKMSATLFGKTAVGAGAGPTTGDPSLNGAVGARPRASRGNSLYF